MQIGCWRGGEVRLDCMCCAPQDRAYEIVEDPESNKHRKMKKRICLVLDCLCAHDFSGKTADLINLQHYVIKEKRLSERETIVIFYDVVRVVEALHKVGGPSQDSAACGGLGSDPRAGVAGPFSRTLFSLCRKTSCTET